MGFMDKVKETATKTGEMAKGAAKAGQEKLDEQKTKKKIGELKEELGGIVYAQRTGTAEENADAEVDRIVGEITAAEEALAAIGADSEAAGTGTDAVADAAADAGDEAPAPEGGVTAG